MKKAFERNGDRCKRRDRFTNSSIFTKPERPCFCNIEEKRGEEIDIEKERRSRGKVVFCVGEEGKEGICGGENGVDGDGGIGSRGRGARPLCR